MNPVWLGAFGTVFGVVVGAPLGIWLKHMLDTRREREAHRRAEQSRQAETQERVLEELGTALRKLRLLRDEPSSEDVTAAREWVADLDELMEDARYCASRLVSEEYRVRFTALDVLSEWQRLARGPGKMLTSRVVGISERKLRLAVVAECLNLVASALRGEQTAPQLTADADAVLSTIAEFQDYLAMRRVLEKSAAVPDLGREYSTLEGKFGNMLRVVSPELTVSGRVGRDAFVLAAHELSAAALRQLVARHTGDVGRDALAIEPLVRDELEAPDGDDHQPPERQ